MTLINIEFKKKYHKYINFHAFLTVISNKFQGLKYNENLQQVGGVLGNKVKTINDI